MPRDAVKNRATVNRNLFQYLGPQLFRLTIFHLDKLWRDPGLQRKPPQNPPAERVDGLDFQAPRCLQRAGKQRSRQSQLVRTQIDLAQRLQLRPQFRIRFHRPCAQTAEKTVLHLRCCRFRIRQTQDFLWWTTGQQQPRHAVGQYPRFARAGIRRNPSRVNGNRRLNLRRRGVFGCVHSIASASNSAPSCHSPNLERWS